MSKKLNTAVFIERANKIHGNKYNYSKVKYFKSNEKIIIICPVHGEFLQAPYIHLNGSGCKKCHYKKLSNLYSLNNKEFVKKAKKIHGNKYNYSKVKYINSTKKIIIVCPIHGEFLQTPNNHIYNKSGCWNCGRKSLQKSLAENAAYFIRKSKKIHKDKYNYSHVIYKNKFTKVKIICLKHGEFLQAPKSHYQYGCRICGYESTISKGEIQFLDHLNISKKNRQIPINNFIVDGINTRNKIIYEFLGDYWHGNPKKYKKNKINIIANKTFGELYEHTFYRFDILKNIGYKIYYIWESDWNNFKKKKCDILNIQIF